ncbi:MAG: hypothetical protein KME54_29025 [Tolypothrix brevis GSE-NOS-MK-07-07A]|nr:hypothetical protein [Tolypothrix brevis GSE-NOS-MK-07-07A]MBW4480773.1 hypothetical protein [Tolypothrix brevis GSE-NOS-MK-07-07A]
MVTDVSVISTCCIISGDRAHSLYIYFSILSQLVNERDRINPKTTKMRSHHPNIINAIALVQHHKCDRTSLTS